MHQDPITSKLLRWYAGHARDLPWRRTRDPYFIWVSEIMLQQTQVDTVIPYYLRFLKKFPSVQALAQAQPDEVLKLWENLGYYSRARHLHAAAKEIVARQGGRIPRDRKELLSLPGIGAYTADAILSIAFGQPIAAVDGNVSRVISRLFAIRKPLGSPESRKQVRKQADQLLSKKHPGHFNQAVMDLGATVCTPRSPSCVSCPLRGACKANALGQQEQIPSARKRPALPHKHMMAAILIDRKMRVLVVQRPAAGLLGGLWRFPGGEKEENEALEEALVRTLRGELGLQVRVMKALASVKHAYTHFRVTFHVYRCAVAHGRVKPIEGLRWKWVSAEDLGKLALSKGERKILAALHS
ncbi:MAG: A/G-specific adenine glycosylase [Desulfobacterota bacterium]|nr:A/G-specific adenine glycosylase [Thermodesulfobacteriota bacterium]